MSFGLRPSEAEAMAFAESIGVKPDHNYICVLNKLNNFLVSTLVAGGGNWWFWKAMFERDYIILVTPQELIIKKAKGHKPVMHYRKQQVEDFLVRDSEMSPFTKIISFSESGKKHAFRLDANVSIGRMAYNNRNFQILEENNWLGFKKA